MAITCKKRLKTATPEPYLAVGPVWPRFSLGLQPFQMGRFFFTGSVLSPTKVCKADGSCQSSSANMVGITLVRLPAYPLGKWVGAGGLTIAGQPCEVRQEAEKCTSPRMGPAQVHW